MPGTTRYSATFDRPYEEDDRVDPSPPPTARRSRSQSWQANSGLDSRPYTPLGGRILSQRSSSTDNGPSKIAEHIPTRTVNKTVVKPHTNPFQFVKVGTCPLYRKAEEQLKKVKEVKKPDVLEEEEEWQSNLDSWKSRRRKMSEDVFRRQEEIKQFELEEQVSQVSQKKTKTFSEMVESRAHRGRALSLCLISSPMELQNWEFENSHKNGSCSTFSGESEENSTANSEDEGVSLKGMLENSPNGAHNSHRTNGNSHIENDNADSHNGNYSKLSDISNNSLQMKSKEGSYIDSGLESISSHRAGDTPDSGSDFSHDSGSSIDCDSPRTGVNILEEFSSKSAQLSNGNEIPVKLCSTQKGQDFGFTFLGGKDRGQFLISSILEGSKADLSIHLGDQIISIDGAEIASKTQKEVASLIEKARERGEITLLLWRHTKCNSNDSPNGVLMNGQQSNGIKVSDNQMSYKSESYEKSIESENEMFVDDFEELQRQSELAAASNKSQGVYALNVSPATQNSKEGFSVNSLFPLSPVTELPSPEDAKTLASSLSLEITSVSDDSTNSKESKSDVNVKASTDKKNPNSPKANVQQVEESITTNSVDTLNVVFQSQPKNINSENLSNNLKNLENNSNKTSGDLVADILPVEKVAEEMEKLILQQLEEEERAKELASGLQTKSPFGSPEHLLTAPPKLTEPPKEKPPPPPPVSEETTKDSSIKRTNSTKRIKKEIHKRRSNFLGIENENSVAIEPSIPPPPALEEILKAEMELERQTRLQIENAAAERLTLEEKELMQREREIIETLESEERQKQLMNNVEEFYDIGQSNENDATVEEQIEFLKSEQKRLELERINEEQQLRLLEETQMRELKEREEFIKKQEADKSPVSDPSSHSVPKESNTLLSPLSVDTKSQVSNSGAFGDGKSLTTNSDSDISKTKSLDSAAPKVSQKPSVPPKPLKKKEAIRKERERLRQEQEALQREREEHRRKLQQEQEELAKQQKPHAPDAPVSRLGPLPPLVQPSFYSPLTATPFTRDVSCPSRSHHGASNIPVGNLNSVELTTPIVAKQGPMPPVRKPVQNEPWGQQKVTSVRKQNQDSLTESRYNQNHWLIQEAEMRRIAELKDRQRRTQLSRSQPNLAEDDVCSNGSRVSVLSPSHSQQHMNYPVQDKMWNYNQPNVMPIKKYPSPVAKEPLHVIYPRDTVPQQPPPKPSRVVPIERQEQMLSVSGRKRCSHCNEELGRGAAMIIESLQLYYHIHCFQCCVCQAQLGNGSCGTDVRVRNQKLHCHNCYSNDEAGLKFSQV